MSDKANRWPKSTREVAQVLGLRPARLGQIIWDGRLPAPAKGPGGAFLWSPEDAERAAWAVCHTSWDALVERQLERDREHQAAAERRSTSAQDGRG